MTDALTLLDHVFFVFLAVVAPISAKVERRRLEAQIASGDPAARSRAYARITAWQWAMGLGLLAAWLIASRDLAWLGIVPPAGPRFWIAAAIGAAITGALVWQLRAAESRPDVAALVRESARPLAYMLPATRTELHRFYALGFTAGCVEELLFRGFMIWYIGTFVPVWAALILSSLIFGMGHSYQGLSGVFKTALAGAAFGGLYWLSGSLWVPAAVHAAADIIQGRMVFDAMRAAPPAQPVAEPATDAGS